MSTKQAPDTETAISAKSLGKVYRGEHQSVTALKELSFSVSRGEFFSIVGPSGCGKSTLLRIIARLIDATTGDFEVNSREGSRPENSVVFQEHALFPWRTVQKNVEFGLEMRGVPKQERSSTARDYLRKVGLEGFEDLYPHQLSGGMQQRVNISRAFANDPEVLLMDEPLGALDAQTRHVLQEELLRIWNEEDKTIIYITHSLEEAILMSDRIGLMTSRPGTLKDVYEVDIPRPRTNKTRNRSDFNELYSELWASLEDEVQASMELRPAESE